MAAPEPPQPAGVSPGLALPDAALQATATLPVQDAGRPTRGTAGYLNGSTTDTGPQAALFAGQGSAVLPTQRQAPVGDTGMTDVLGQGFPGASGHGPAETAVLPAVAPQAPPARQPRDLPTSTGAPRRTPPSQSKAGNQRKIAAAGDLLFRRAAQLTTAATAVQAAPAPQSGWATGVQQVPQPLPEARAATEQWQQPGQPGLQQQPAPIGFQAQSQLDAGQWQQPSGAIPGMAAAPGMTAPTGPAASLATTPPTPEVGSPAHPLPALTDTGSYSPVPAPSLSQMAATTAPLPLPAPHTARAAKAIAFARAQVGKPCVWGATGPDSYDCSSLTQAAWRAAGVALPRAAHEQAVAGTPVTLAGLEPGDLVLFFDDDRHVGLHIGGGMMVHAPGPGSSIREESIYGAGESAIHRVIRPA
ncbi:C40 family peptidase [Streptomyces bungoensis]|uniref:C40 family peptidase n=1 Tax=Streptomyces bungoensis TaxID=285568 RepID=UPI003416FE4A